MEFNQENCLKLLQEERELFQQGSSLWHSDKMKYRELSYYLKILEENIFWLSHYNYLQILEEFSNQTISVNEFVSKFCDLRYENFQSVDMLKENPETELKDNFPLNSESLEFVRIISMIYSSIDLYDPNLEDSESNEYAISQEALRRLVENDYLPLVLSYCEEP